MGTIMPLKFQEVEDRRLLLQPGEIITVDTRQRRTSDGHSPQSKLLHSSMTFPKHNSR